MLLLSLGTGKAERSYEYDDAKDWGPLGWARPVLDIMMTGVAETVHYQLEQIFDAAQNADNYTRIDPRLDRALGLDDADDASIDALELLGRRVRVAAESGATLDAVVGGLTATGSRSSDGGTAERQVATE